ncbi:uncharacterized protein SPAPADRAFT_60011 [Spathaspora passalidarum NRRL Y-27907]|uniref:Uncharacterized protein n=1 Tax=Spathaspora passalidarum (strain NRRL Y-27907 / 11-Y1) TaxID=619300 RepID=G3AJC2_SPAPN|nr:uncharacterized protein SPAPADRAFT_60011 [Spathaspora passalidarum NRRL Y-27907]EGW34581.1 hypothetical protein SPAPADRAFT_60011 [Spathaspora passalidarum NRRL Y-27907]
MSNQSTHKQFDSKLLHYLRQYSLIQYVNNLVFSFSITNTLYAQYVAPVAEYVNTQISSVSYSYNLATFIDGVSTDVLLLLDKLLLQYPAQTLDSITKTYVKPIDNKLVEVNNKYFRPIEETKTEGFTKLWNTVKNIATNLKASAFSKSTEIQKNLVDTYNQELSSTTKQNVIGKNIEASYNTASKTIKTLNEDYITPLKAQTQDIVDQFAAQTKNKADEIIKTKVNPKIDELKQKKDDFLQKNNTFVSASA